MAAAVVFVDDEQVLPRKRPKLEDIVDESADETDDDIDERLAIRKIIEALKRSVFVFPNRELVVGVQNLGSNRPKFVEPTENELEPVRADDTSVDESECLATAYRPKPRETALTSPKHVTTTKRRVNRLR